MRRNYSIIALAMAFAVAPILSSCGGEASSGAQPGGEGPEAGQGAETSIVADASLPQGGAEPTGQADISQAPKNNNGTSSVNLPGSHETPADRADGADDELIEITERLFVGQVNDIYINAEDYIGKTLRYQGLFQTSLWPETGEVYCYVVRNGPGCCGTDSNPGFEVIWEDDSDKEYPSYDDWVEATGVLESYEEDGYTYLRVNLESLEVMDERGLEYVTQ
jgi:uncharacterized membrane protein YcgQ (UPF0703/DUF1980 family)